MNDKNMDQLINNMFIFSKSWGQFMNLLINQVEDGVPKVYLGILFCLRKGGPMPISRIAQKLSIAKPNMTSNIDGLAERGWVRRCTSDKDRRLINIELTKEGREFIDITVSRLNALLKEKLSILNEDEVSQVIYSVNTLIKVSIQLMS